MFSIQARNINGAYEQGLDLLKRYSSIERSRNGVVMVLPSPLVTTYQHPRERVLFCAERRSNPFFHMMEALWMIDGRNDSGWPTYFNSRMATFANEEGTFDGAYGHRWRYHFGLDQLEYIVRELTDRPDSRRAVLTMFDPTYDLNVDSKDVPCNTHIYFSIRSNMLDMTVCCRSNDAIWGAYGANVVHMSMLQEVLASQLSGVSVGQYVQLSNNFHYYPRHEALVQSAISPDLYKERAWSVFPLVHKPASWLAELREFLEDPTLLRKYDNFFFSHVAQPMLLAYKERKEKGGDGSKYVEMVEDAAWNYACEQYILQRSSDELQEG